MGKMIFFIFINLISTHLFANEEVECKQNQSEKVEIFSLMATVKNDILGSVPKFCKSDAAPTLNDQLDEGEDALNDFVRELKKNPPEKDAEDIMEIKKENEEENQNILLNLLKVTILRKMWLQSNEENKYKVLTSKQCANFSLNKLLINDKFDSKIKEKDSKSSLKTIFNVCEADEMKDIAPFFTKDVLAETILNFKILFPKSYSHFIDMLCGEMVLIDELIFKKDNYSDFEYLEKDVNSAKKFTHWLKEIAAKDLKNKSFPTNDYNQKILTSAEFLFNQQQEKLKKDYEAKQEPGKEEGAVEVLQYPGATPLILYKNSKGKYYYKKTEEGLQKEADSLASLKQQQNIQNINNAASYPKMFYNKMKTIYENNVGSLENGFVAIPDYPDYLIGKNEDGKYFLVVKNQDKILKEIELLEKKISEKTEKFYLSKPEQAKLKTTYEMEKISLDEDLDNSKTQSVVLNEKGIYVKNPLYAKNYLFNDSNKKIVEDNAVKEAYKEKLGLDTVLPLPFDSNYYAYGLKNYAPQGMYGEIGGVKLNEFDFTQKAQEIYQSRTTDIENKKLLTSQEIAALESYTGSSYGNINSCLRASSCNENILNQVEKIKSSLEKLKSEKWKNDTNSYQVLFRGTNSVPSSIAESLAKDSNEIVLDKGFMSASGDIRIARSFSGSDGYIFVLKSKSCVGISFMSLYKSEDEFLCPPGLKFKSKIISNNSEKIIVLEEVN